MAYRFVKPKFLVLSAIYFSLASAYAVTSTQLGPTGILPVNPQGNYVLAMGTSYASHWSYYGQGRYYWNLGMYTGGNRCASGTTPYVQVYITQAQSNPNEQLKFIGIIPDEQAVANNFYFLLQPNLVPMQNGYMVPIWIREVSTGGTTPLAQIGFGWTLYCIVPNTAVSTYVW